MQNTENEKSNKIKNPLLYDILNIAPDFSKHDTLETGFFFPDLNDGMKYGNLSFWAS